jgi:hypothetical protein
MNPASCPVCPDVAVSVVTDPELLVLGKGGEEDVSVVAKRVGLNRFESGCVGNERDIYEDSTCTYPLLPNQTVVAEVL